MKFEEVHNNKSGLLLQCISGSKAYGLDTPASDTDIKGVFFLPQNILLGLDYFDQVSNKSNDIMYYELKRFFELLNKNNPNILELLATPAEMVMFKHPLMDLIKPETFLSKLCCQTFAGYAASQIKKAKGLNKKINNEVDIAKKSIIDFCYVIIESRSVPLGKWLTNNKYEQERCGLVKIEHFKDAYALFYQSQTTETVFNGINSGMMADDVKLSSVPQNLKPLCIMNFNKDGYSMYCRDYKEYWEWVENRNEGRYLKNIEHGKSYDTKNMMHTFRLLKMANEIAVEGKINVRRTDRDFLFKIRNGGYEYEELLQMSQKLLDEIKVNFEKSALPDKPNERAVNDLLVQLRTELLN